jgi:hypothetical protein
MPTKGYVASLYLGVLMAISAIIDTSVSPFTLTVVSDSRLTTIGGTVTVGDESAPYSAQVAWPITFDADSHVWTKVSDDGTTAVYTY